MSTTVCLGLLLFAFAAAPQGASGAYYGVKLGTFSVKTLHKVKGDVYVADENSFYFVNFDYDGQGPAAYFWVGKGEPDTSGTIVPNEHGSKDVLKSYHNATFAVTLSGGKKVTDYDYISVYCRDHAANFGHIRIPPNFQLPREQSIGSMNGLHSVKADDVVLKDSETILLKNFRYDGAGPDAHFLVGNTDSPDHRNAVRIPDENQSHNKLEAYTGKDVTLMLPKDTWADYRWFSVYCVMASTSFAHLNLPSRDALHVPARFTKTNNAVRDVPSVFLLLGLSLFVIFQVGQPLWAHHTVTLGKKGSRQH